MAKTKITMEMIKAYSVADRHELYKKARVRDDEDAKLVLKMIEECGLPFSESGGIKNSNPLSLAIFEIVNSPAGISAALAAQASGLPPMAGIDPLIVEVLGVDYGAHNMTTVQAGSMVGEMMRSKGFVKTGEASLPATCVARTASLFAPKKK